MSHYLIYTSLIYTNAPPHVGHLYELVVANSLCECLKNWYNVKLAIGADDHGAKIQNCSKLKAVSATKISNLNSNKLLSLCSKYEINVKDWTSTSYPKHVNLVKNRLCTAKFCKATRKSNYCGWYSPQLDCYCSSDEVRFEKNLMYCVTNVPTEWTEEQAIFLNVYNLKCMLFALFRARLIRAPFISDNFILENVRLLEDVCITRSKTVNYGIKVITKQSKLTLWVWIDAILAYTKVEDAHKVHIVGKDITKFHLTHYIILSILCNSRLPKIIVQHSYITASQVKISKSLGNQPTSVDFQAIWIYYYLSTRPLKNDLKLTKPALSAAANKLINNVGNLAKRLIKLLKLYRPKLSKLTISDWITVTYIKQLEAVLKYLAKSFKLNEINNITLDGTTKVNSLISNYKLWRNTYANHKVFIYSFVTKKYIKWLKHSIGNTAKLIVQNMQNTNTNYTPFLKNNNKIINQQQS
ncbi:Methionine--tRNA ligase [Candidatus Hodgkinia cicadicola]|nr:Methionine--tRNA ligase [Candidatus Hodgkinia cicadicola]